MHAATVLILQADRFAAESLRDHIVAAHPAAHCRLARCVQEAGALLAAEPVDSFVTAVDLPDGDVLDLLLRSAHPRRSTLRTLAIVAHPAPRLLESLHSLGVNGVFDSLHEPPARIADALRTIHAGGTYISVSFRSHRATPHSHLVRKQLTATEQLGLAIMGVGCSDKVAASLLGMTLLAVRTLRRDIYAKLRVHDKEEMMRLALQLGYTRSTAAGLAALGLGVLVLEYQGQSKRPLRLPAALFAACGLPPDYGTVRPTISRSMNEGGAPAPR